MHGTYFRVLEGKMLKKIQILMPTHVNPDIIRYMQCVLYILDCAFGQDNIEVHSRTQHEGMYLQYI